MSFRDIYNKMKDRAFGKAEETPAPEPRGDLGPAKVWYIKRLFYRGTFTKKLTRAREVEIRGIFRTLRPEQRAIALRKGWNKGLDV